MTEQEWAECSDPTPMLEFLRGKASDRKLRLFALDCCSFVKDFLDERGSKALETAEQYVDGRCGLKELETGRSLVYEAFYEFDDSQGRESAASAVECLCHAEDLSDMLNEIARTAAALAAVRQPPHLKRATRRLRRLHQCRLLREIVSNPFRPLAISSAWRTADVRALAEATYEERSLPSGELDNTRLAILADALEETGCGNAALLEHLRGPGPHTRGCWAVDLVLGKE